MDNSHPRTQFISLTDVNGVDTVLRAAGVACFMPGYRPCQVGFNRRYGMWVTVGVWASPSGSIGALFDLCAFIARRFHVIYIIVLLVADVLPE